MPFRYINPGFAELVHFPFVYGTKPQSYQSNIFNPTNSTSIYQGNDSINFILPIQFNDNPSDLYCSFDFFPNKKNCLINTVFSSNNQGGTLNGDQYGIKIYPVSTQYYLFANVKGKYTGEASPTQISPQSLYHIWFHLHVNPENNHFIEFKLNSDPIIKTSFSNDLSISQDYKLWFKSTEKDMFFSNIIVSDSYINPKERVVILPVSSTDSDMSLNDDGSFSADLENQFLLQAVDSSNLISDFGALSKVTGIGIAAVPAYKSAEGLSTLISLDKLDDDLHQRTSFALSSDSISGVLDSWATDNLTVSDINGKQFGFMVAS